MAEQRQIRQQQQQQQQQRPTDAIKEMLPDKAPSKSQVLAVVTLLPVGGTLLLLSGLTLAGALIGLAVTTPLFVICSPVLVPAALVIGLAILGFLTSGAFGITALSALSWMANFLRMRVPEQMERAQETAGQLGQKVQETAGQLGQKAQETPDQLGQKAKETGQTIQSKGQEVGRDVKEGGKT